MSPEKRIDINEIGSGARATIHYFPNSIRPPMAAAGPGSPCRTDVQLVPAAVPASEACRRAGRGLGTGRILDSMALDIAAVQAALAEDGLDGWLLYDFHGSNPIARSLAGLNGGGKMTTRRWYYLVPRIGSPRALVHAIEPNTLDTLPGDKTLYAGREALAQGLDDLVEGLGRVAM